MRRIVMWLMSTVTVVVLLFGYHTSTTGAQPQQTVVTAPLAGSSGSSGSSPSRSTSGSGPGANNNRPKPARVVTGPVVQTQWGPVEVQIKVANGRISQVAVPTYPSGNSTDAQINSYALPRLVQETLSAQSAQIQMISGATVTSTGYVQSLQGAIDRAGI